MTYSTPNSVDTHQPQEQLSIMQIEKAYAEPAALEGKKIPEYLDAELPFHPEGHHGEKIKSTDPETNSDMFRFHRELATAVSSRTSVPEPRQDGLWGSLSPCGFLCSCKKAFWCLYVYTHMYRNTLKTSKKQRPRFSPIN